MVSDLRSRIESIEIKAKLLMERYEHLRKSHENAQERIIALEAEVTQRDKRIESLEHEAEYLRVASVLAPDHGVVEQTRDRLTELVREIDSCIDKLSL